MQELSLLAFAINTVFGLRFALDEVIYLCRSAPKASKFSKTTNDIGWMQLVASFYFIMNDFSWI